MIKNKKAFTLIELLVVITIIVIITIFTYSPYLLYKNKAGVNISTKQIAQNLYLSRAMAINGINSGTGITNRNLSIGLYLEAGKNKKIIFYGYSGALDISKFKKGIILKKENLQSNIQIKNISSKSGALFFFSAISGKPEIYLNNSGNLSLTGGTEFKINIAYKGTNSAILNKTVKYNKNTFVIDY